MTPRECVAAAVGGDVAALRLVAGDPALARLAVDERLGPRLARMVLATTEVVADPEAKALLVQAGRGSAVSHLILDELLTRVGPALAATPWRLIKGADLRDRIYESREDRVVGDVDLLVAAQSFGSVCDGALAAGFRNLHEIGPHYEDFLHREAHAWQARLPSSGLLEVHPRLWGLLPASAASDVLAQAEGDPPRPALADAYVLCAVHAFLDAPPRRLATWLELATIAAHLDTAGLRAAEARAQRWGVGVLMVAAARAVERWFPAPAPLPGRALPLRATERIALGDRDAGTISYSRLALARLLAGRPSRMGWLAVWRRVWPHAGLVERATPSAWSWPRRRLEAWRRGIS